MSARGAAVVVVLAGWPAFAAAQSFDGTAAVDAFTGPAAADGRIIGLGGAVVGVAEGVASSLVNPAAVAHRRRDLDDGWDLGGTLTWFVPAATEVGRQDVGNDGRADVDLLSVQNFQLGGNLQFGRLGLGLMGTVWRSAARRTAGDVVAVSASDVAIVAGFAAKGDELAFGAALTVGSGEMNWYAPGVEPVGAGTARVSYAGARFRLGALLRPRGATWRVGVAWDPGAVAEPSDDRASFPVPTPSRFVFPWSVSVGASRWLGPNALLYNEPPIRVPVEGGWGPGPALDRDALRPVLVTAQVDLVGPSDGAVTMESAIVPDRPVVASGARASVVARLGVEWEAWRRIARVRAGTYLEPSRSGADPRLHGTGGIEFRIPFWPWDLQAGAAADLASRYRNVSLSVGFWSETGPVEPLAP